MFLNFLIYLHIYVTHALEYCLFLGSTMECLYALKSFGIPSDQIPLITGRTKKRKRRRNETPRINDVGVDNNNDYDNKNIKLENHIKWIELCQLKESNLKSYGRKWKQYDENKQIIECPNHILRFLPYLRHVYQLLLLVTCEIFRTIIA